MPQSLYQKYRPTTWAELTDQQAVKVTLQHEIERGQISHAYLFVGPRGVGKTTTARLFAKAINCTARAKKSADPCGSCESCTRIHARQSFDLIEIDAASHTGVDHVREHIVGAAEVAAGHGTYRVFIIDEVHMLSTAAFNAMLKMLEEPPSHVVFILATTEVHKVPATIVSRCQRFDFKKIPVAAMRERLRKLAHAEGVEVDEEVLTRIAEHADGSLRDAESTLGQVLTIGTSRIGLDEASLIIPRATMREAAELIGHCVDGQAGHAVALVNDRIEAGIQPGVYMNDCIAWLRALLLAKVAERLDLYSREAVGELHEELVRQIESTSVDRIRRMIDIFVERRRMLGESPLPQLPLELAVVEAALVGSDGAMPPARELPVATSSGTTESKPSTAKTRPNVRTQESHASVTIDQLKAGWGDVLERVKERNRSLSYVLANASPVGIDGQRISLAVQYPFHVDRIGDTKNRSLLKEIAEAVFGTSLDVEAVLVEGDPVPVSGSG